MIHTSIQFPVWYICMVYKICHLMFQPINTSEPLSSNVCLYGFISSYVPFNNPEFPASALVNVFVQFAKLQVLWQRNGYLALPYVMVRSVLRAFTYPSA
jgi:hypothetical protein